MKLLGILALGFSAMLVVTLIGVPIRAWSDPAPFVEYLRPVAAWGLALVLVVAAGCVLAQPRAFVGAPGRALAVVGIAVAVLCPVFAWAQDVASTTVNLGDVFGDLRSTIVTVISAIVMGIVALLAAAVKKSTGLTIDTKMQERVQSAMMTGVHLGLDRVQAIADRTDIDVKSQIIAGAIQYARSYAAKDIKGLKLSEYQLEDLARAEFQKIVPQRTLVTVPPSNA